VGLTFSIFRDPICIPFSDYDGYIFGNYWHAVAFLLRGGNEQ
jgi:hypothetical protein